MDIVVIWVRGLMVDQRVEILKKIILYQNQIERLILGYQLNSSIFYPKRVISNLWQNLTNHPLEALKECALLYSMAYFLTSFQSVSYLFLILSQIILSIQQSVGRPPPSFLSQPFFFHRSRFLRGIPNYLEMIFTSSPDKIYMAIQIPVRLLAFSLGKCTFYMALSVFSPLFMLILTILQKSHRTKCYSQLRLDEKGPNRERGPACIFRRCCSTPGRLRTPLWEGTIGRNDFFRTFTPFLNEFNFLVQQSTNLTTIITFSLHIALSIKQAPLKKVSTSINMGQQSYRPRCPHYAFLIFCDFMIVNSQVLNDIDYKYFWNIPMSQETKSQKTEIKKQTSYTYWVDDNNKSRELPLEHRPKKISPPKQQQSTTSNGPSKWNTSGTWQQRSIPKKELNQAIQQSISKYLTDNTIELVLKSVDIEGEFKQIFSNNKRKLLYETSGKIKFEGEDLQIQIDEISCSGDREFSVKGKKKEEKERLSKVCSKLIDLVVSVYNRYKE